VTYSLILDSLVALLLVVTIGYAYVLNKKLGSLRRDKSELEKLAMSFANATVRAEESIGKLKTTTDGLHARMDKAEALRDDLVFLTDRGDSAANRLETHIREARGMTGVANPSESDETAAPNMGIETKEDELLAQQRAEQLREQEARNRPPMPEPRPLTATRVSDSEPTEAEKELLKALRSAG